MNQTSNSARSMRAEEKKSQTNSLAFHHRTEWEKKEKKCNCLAHINYICLCMCICVQAFERAVEREKKSELHQGAKR